MLFLISFNVVFRHRTIPCPRPPKKNLTGFILLTKKVETSPSLSILCLYPAFPSVPKLKADAAWRKREEKPELSHNV